MRRRYDFAFALGSTCTCTDLLRKAGLQLESFPLDWIGRTVVDTPIGEVMRSRAEQIVTDFEGMLLKENLEFISRDGDHVHARIGDRATGLAFYHDFPAGRDIADSYDEVVAKYARRIRRFRNRLESSRTVLVYWQADARDAGRVGAGDIEYCLAILARAFPYAKFDMLLLEFPYEGQTADVVRKEGPGYVRFALEYRVAADGEVSWLVEDGRILPFLRRCSVRDYRSREERREYRKRQRQKEMAAFKTQNLLELFWRKLQYRAYRHLRKRLERHNIRIEEV